MPPAAKVNVNRDIRMRVPLTPRAAALINERILISRAPHERTSKSRRATSISLRLYACESEREREKGGGGREPKARDYNLSLFTSGFRLCDLARHA